MAELTKKDIKEVVIEALEPFAKSIKEDFNRVDERFEKVDERFEKVENRLGKVESDIVVLTVNMQEGFKEFNERLSNLESKIDKIYNTLDSFVTIVERLQQEFTVMKYDINKIKAVIKEKLGVDLT